MSEAEGVVADVDAEHCRVIAARDMQDRVRQGREPAYENSASAAVRAERLPGICAGILPGFCAGLLPGL